MKSSSKGKRTAAAAVPVPTPAPRAGATWWHYAAALVGVFFFVWFVYGPALSGPFLLDDSYLPYMLDGYADAPLSAWVTSLRPMLMFSFWLNFQQSAQEPFAYHMVNMLLHFANGVLVWLALRRLLTWGGEQGWRRDWLAAFAGGLFLVHPLQTEAVSYVASRSETLSVFFFLAAFVVFLYRRTEAASWWIAAGVLALFAAACMTKEHGAVLLVLLLLTDYYWTPGFSLRGICRNWRLYVPIVALAALAVAYVFTRVLATTGTAGFRVKEFTWVQYFFTQCRAIWVYLRMFALPYGQNLDHEFAISRNVLDHGALFGLIGLVALVAVAWIYRKRFPMASYGVFVFLALIAPTSSVVPIVDPLVERRLYLPFIGLLLVTVGLLQHWKTSRGTLTGTLAVVLLATAFLCYQRNRLYANSIDMWTDSAAKSPAKVRPHFQLAYAYYQAGSCDRAADEFAKTAQLAKPDFSLLLDWALAYDCASRPGEALAKFREAAEIEPSAHVYSQIGMEYAKQKQYAQALDELKLAEQLDPRFAMTYFYRGNIYTEQGLPAKAAEEYRRALAADPKLQVAQDALARTGR
jgi:tetratricopeptide (TPR) repeat protein